MTEYTMCKDIPRGAIVSAHLTWGTKGNDAHKLVPTPGAFGVLGDEVAVTIDGRDYTAFELFTSLRKAYILADNEYVQHLPDCDVSEDTLAFAERLRREKGWVRIDKPSVIDEVRKEYNRCKHLISNPMQSAQLFGVAHNAPALQKYYEHRAEGLGFALDRLEREEREAAFNKPKTPEIKTPVVSANDLVGHLYQLTKETASQDADMTIVLGEDDLIVSEIRWNDMGDGIEIKVFKA